MAKRTKTEDFLSSTFIESDSTHASQVRRCLGPCPGHIVCRLYNDNATSIVGKMQYAAMNSYSGADSPL